MVNDQRGTCDTLQRIFMRENVEGASDVVPAAAEKSWNVMPAAAGKSWDVVTAAMGSADAGLSENWDRVGDCLPKGRP